MHRTKIKDKEKFFLSLFPCLLLEANLVNLAEIPSRVAAEVTMRVGLDKNKQKVFPSLFCSVQFMAFNPFLLVCNVMQSHLLRSSLIRKDPIFLLSQIITQTAKYENTITLLTT